MHPVTQVHILNFPSFWEGLSLRHRPGGGDELSQTGHFPSFLEGLSLRQEPVHPALQGCIQFPFLF